jgi:hypothetical protein
MTAREALSIAVEHNGGRALISPSVHDEFPPNCFVFGYFNDCWFILSLFASSELVLRSSRLIVVSREQRKVIFDGEANDEG